MGYAYNEPFSFWKETRALQWDIATPENVIRFQAPQLTQSGPSLVTAGHSHQAYRFLEACLAGLATSRGSTYVLTYRDETTDASLHKPASTFQSRKRKSRSWPRSTQQPWCICARQKNLGRMNEWTELNLSPGPFACRTWKARAKIEFMENRVFNPFFKYLMWMFRQWRLTLSAQCAEGGGNSQLQPIRTASSYWSVPAQTFVSFQFCFDALWR